MEFPHYAEQLQKKPAELGALIIVTYNQ